MGMELIKFGSIKMLLPKIVRDDSKLSDIDAATMMKSITEAISYIHEKGVIHRDLKLANILIDDPNDFSSIKIIDFGLGER
jgi:serine/threonine protein kinase